MAPHSQVYDALAALKLVLVVQNPVKLTDPDITFRLIIANCYSNHGMPDTVSPLFDILLLSSQAAKTYRLLAIDSTSIHFTRMTVVLVSPKFSRQ